MSTDTDPTATGELDGPLTVSITRRVAPEDELLMQAWVHAGTSMAERFEGFLGAGWVRSGTEDWHMLYRFDSRDHLDTWERSPERLRWLRSAADLVEHRRTEYRTGIEGWFDEPTSRRSRSRAGQARPRRRAGSRRASSGSPSSRPASRCPTSSRRGAGTGPSSCGSSSRRCSRRPWMTYVFLPFVTRLFGRWLKAD